MSKRRALIMAGGGVKVAFQAGVLQVWLDEAGLIFDHADGASGGTFNLAMWSQGMTGREIADAWRRTKPADGVSLNAPQFARLLWARSLFTLDGYRQNVFPGWGLDWDKIRSSPREATFNVYNFTRQELEIMSAAQMDEDRLCACVSLPMWFPPVVIDGDAYIDAVYVLDANVEEAIRRGADEIWVVWTVSMLGTWDDGFVANYFQIIEAAANGRFKLICRRIEDNNAAIATGKPGEFGRTISLQVLQSEVPIHYLVNFNQDRLVECVNLGVQQARQWCRDRGIALTPASDAPAETRTVTTSLGFTEEMKGFLMVGAVDPEVGFSGGKKAGSSATLHLAIDVQDVDRFVTEPAHEAVATGWIELVPFGGRMPVTEGRFNLFVDDGNPHKKHMTYRIFFRDVAGRPFTLSGRKIIESHPGSDIWSDTTTLYARVLDGHLPSSQEGAANVVAAGILRLHLTDFLHEMGTFRTAGPTLGERTTALTRFGKLFLGSLWDVYATHFLSYAPL